MRRLYRLLVAALIRRRTISLEWYLALQTATCGAWIMVVVAYAGFARERWRPFALMVGLVACACGVAATLILARGRYTQPRTRRNLDWCRRSMFTIALLWSMLTILSAWTRPLGLTWPVLFWNVLAALWCYSRLHLRFKED